jgi:hypothetical protein
MQSYVIIVEKNEDLPWTDRTVENSLFHIRGVRLTAQDFRLAKEACAERLDPKLGESILAVIPESLVQSGEVEIEVRIDDIDLVFPRRSKPAVTPRL